MADKYFDADGTPNLERLSAMREGDIYNERDDRRITLLAAKEADDGSDGAKKRRRAAAESYDRFRTFWRAVDVMQPGSTRPAAPITSKD